MPLPSHNSGVDRLGDIEHWVAWQPGHAPTRLTTEDEATGYRTAGYRVAGPFIPAAAYRGAVEAARVVIEASEPCAVGNRHVLIEHLDALAKACGLPPVGGR